MRKLKRRKFVTVRVIQERAVKAARAIIEADGWDQEKLKFSIGRLYGLLELLIEMDPHFEAFVQRYSARVCAAPDCEKVFAPVFQYRGNYQRYHSKSCRSRHNMQKRRGKV